MRDPKPSNDAVKATVLFGDKVLWRLAEVFPPLNVFVVRRERSMARRQCILLLEICRELQKENPGLQGERLYELVVAKRLACDTARARQLVRQADQSFAQWPDERDVNFRDVVNFVIVNNIMGKHRRALGIHVDMVVIVKAAIPEAL